MSKVTHEKQSKVNILIEQNMGLGDVIFLEPSVRMLLQEDSIGRIVLMLPNQYKNLFENYDERVTTTGIGDITRYTKIGYHHIKLSAQSHYDIGYIARYKAFAMLIYASLSLIINADDIPCPVFTPSKSDNDWGKTHVKHPSLLYQINSFRKEKDIDLQLAHKEIASYIDKGYEVWCIANNAKNVPKGAKWVKGFDINQLKSLIATVGLYIGLDSGPTWLANAMGKQGYVRFIATNPDLYLPKLSSLSDIGETDMSFSPMIPLQNRTTPLYDWDKISPETILCISLNSPSNVLTSTPAIRALKRKYPLATLSYYSDATGIGILEGNPYVDNFIRYNDTIHKEDYDVVIDFDLYAPSQEHYIDYYLRIVGCATSNKNMDIYPEHHGLLIKRPYVVLSPRAELNKRWGYPIYWKWISQYLHTYSFNTVMLDSYAKNHSAREVAYLVEQSEFIIGLDSYINHLGKALNKTGIIIWGGATTHSIAWYDTFINILPKDDCRCQRSMGSKEPCPYNRKCLQSITISDIFQAIRSLL
jgi:ADP-heptose:LPS heptosyltransferase